jgi:A/G-specific adenine glycosylase
MTSSRSSRQNPRARLASPPADRPDFVPLLLAWFQRSARDLPWRRTLDPYAIWVSEIMLQQTQVKTVIPYWTRWMKALPDIRSLARAPLDQVLKLWEGLGYYTRARNLQSAAQTVLDQFGGLFPRAFSDVLSLPGIGRYTAGAICSIAFNQPTPILDGNVIRVLTRLFGVRGDPREKRVNEMLWTWAQEAVVRAAGIALPNNPPTASSFGQTAGACSALNQALMELGALICTPKEARCPECPLQHQCQALATGRVDQLPNLPSRPKATERRFIAFALEHRGRWLVHQRPAGQVNAHLWEFPSFELEPTAALPDPARFLEGQLRIANPIFAKMNPLSPIRHTITRYRMTVTPFHTQLLKPLQLRQETLPLVWRTAAEIEALALSSAHRKLWNHLVRRNGVTPAQPAAPAPPLRPARRHQGSIPVCKR